MQEYIRVGTFPCGYHNTATIDVIEGICGICKRNGIVLEIDMGDGEYGGNVCEDCVISGFQRYRMEQGKKQDE